MAGLVILLPARIADARGYFCELYNERRWAAAGVERHFVQDNISLSHSPGTLRGLHFQREPFAQAKLVTVLRGAVKDVVVDLRRSSETFGRHFTVALSAAGGEQLYIPEGFAHGFITLEPDTLLAYKVTAFYSAGHDDGIRFDDPALGIDWGAEPQVVSDRDRALPRFDPARAYFP